MENSGDPNDEDRDDWTDHLVRPYVTDSDDHTDWSLDEPAGGSAPGWPEPARSPEHDTAPLPAHAPAGHRRPGGGAGPRRALGASPREWYLALAVYRLSIAIGAVIVIVAFTGGVLLLLRPSHSATALAGKCRPSPGSCHRIAPVAPGTTLPVTALSPGPAPGTATATLQSTRPAATAGSTTRRAVTAATSGAAATSGPATPTPSATASSPAPAPTATAPGLAPGSTISIQATTACCTSFYIRHDDGDNRVVITQITSGSSTAAKADATWIVQAGLADSSCISLESANDPGRYLRHFHFELYLDQDDGSAQFAHDATFCPRPGNSGHGYSFQSVNYPYKYIRHYDYVVYISSDGGSNAWDTPTLWPDDSTWLVSQPWG
jgi:Alpha-L-arabinofuranosidase B (ABFB) domain